MVDNKLLGDKTMQIKGPTIPKQQLIETSHMGFPCTRPRLEYHRHYAHMFSCINTMYSCLVKAYVE